MQITEVKVAPVNEGALRAFVDITFDKCFAIKELRIIQGPDGLFVAMPNKRRKDGTLSDIVFPINAETRKMIEDRVIEEYRKIISETAMRRALHR